MIKKDNIITIDIQANAFLLHMVRIIVGTLLMVAKRELDPEDVRTILNKKDRKIAGKTVSPSGLYFLDLNILITLTFQILKILLFNFS